jgi:hypothetical protein
MTEDEQKFYDACAIAALPVMMKNFGNYTDTTLAVFRMVDAMLAERRKRMGKSND